MKFFREKKLLFAIVINVILLTGAVIYGFFYNNKKENTLYDETLVARVRQEVMEEPANPDNIRERYEVLGLWISDLLARGIKADTVVTEEDYKDLGKLIEKKEFNKACPRIDKIFAKLEKLLEYEELSLNTSIPLKGTVVSDSVTVMPGKTPEEDSLPVEEDIFEETVSEDNTPAEDIDLLDEGEDPLDISDKPAEKPSSEPDLIDSEYIDRVREEVKEIPTDRENIEERFAVLKAWAFLLYQEGVKIGKVLPIEEVKLIENLIENEKWLGASFKIDEAFKKMENFEAHNYMPPPDELSKNPQEPLIDEAYITKIRQEVKEIPTNEENIEERFKVLKNWSYILVLEGADFKGLRPKKEAQEITNLISEGNMEEASVKVDEAYGKLEKVEENLKTTKSYQ